MTSSNIQKDVILLVAMKIGNAIIKKIGPLVLPLVDELGDK